MENELILKIKPIIEMLPEYIMGLVVVASVVARVFNLPMIAKIAGPIAQVAIKIVGFLPTLGVNPKTKELEKAYLELKQKYEPENK